MGLLKGEGRGASLSAATVEPTVGKTARATASAAEEASKILQLSLSISPGSLKREVQNFWSVKNQGVIASFF